MISWQRAIVLLYLGKVEVLEEYDEDIRSPVSITLRTPAVGAVDEGARVDEARVRFSRMNVFLRDGFRCQYCGEKKAVERAQLRPRAAARSRRQDGLGEHRDVVLRMQRSQGQSHAGRGRHEASSKPFKPKTLPITPAFRLEPSRLPSVWQPYCQSIG